jgi:PKD-like domain/Putative metal-binding motif/Secretion system C-terminal sorting domain
MVRNLFLLVCMLFAFYFSGTSQYLETFATAGKGYKLNNANDFSGVTWTLSGWSADNTTGSLAGRDIGDYFNTTAAGKLEAIDLDHEVFWESPLLNISTAGTVSFSLDLAWAGFDNDIPGNPCTSGNYGINATLDVIKVQYSINGGAYTSVSNKKGGATCATVGYINGSGTGINDLVTVSQPGLSGTTLRIKVIVNTNANAELVTIDNVSVPQAGVVLACSPPVITAPQVTQPTCLVPTGRIIVKATGTETMQYSIDNGATYKNTASFASLAPGNNYRIRVRYLATPACVATYANNPVTINPPPPTPAWYLDADGDGYYGSTQSACSSPGTGWTSTPPSGGGGDCNDDPANGGAAINPGATEICNGKDDNCNGLTDDGLVCNGPTVTAPQVIQPTCSLPTGRIIVRATGTETMQYSIDNGTTFKNTASFTGLAPGSYRVAVRYASSPANIVFYSGNPVIINTPPPPVTWYWDLDNDGFYSSTLTACTSPGTGWTSVAPPGGSGDCNDDPLNGGAAVNPGAIEICNGIDDNCNGWVDDGTIVLAAPTSISGPAGVCRSATNQVFSVAPVPGATSYQWTLPFGATGSSSTNSISLSFSSTYVTGNICVRAVNACGQSAQFCREIKYYGTKPVSPDVISGKAIGLCTNQTYSVTPVLNATNYNWVVPANTSIVSGQGTPQIILSFGSAFSSGTLSVTAANCKGTSSARTLQLSRHPATPASITGPTTEVCGGTTQNYSCPAVAGATVYTWAVPTGAVINSGQGTTAISVTFPATFVSGNISVAAGTSCGNGVPRSISVSSRPLFPSPISGPVSVCPSATGLKYSTAAVAGVTYNWTVPNGVVITAGQGTSSITVNWGLVAGQVKVAGFNSCGSSGYRSLSVSLLTCVTEAVTMAKAEEATPAAGLKVQLWPNPARDVLMVTLDEFVPNQKVELTLMQADGKIQTAQSLTPNIKGQQVRMDVSRAAVGYYFLVAKQQGFVVSNRVVIIR